MHTFTFIINKTKQNKKIKTHNLELFDHWLWKVNILQKKKMFRKNPKTTNTYEYADEKQTKTYMYIKRIELKTEKLVCVHFI